MNIPIKIPKAPEKAEREHCGLSVPTTVGTLDGFRKWILSDEFPDQGVRASFLGTEVFIDKSPERIDTHALVKLEVLRVLGNLVKQTRLGRCSRIARC
jgi:hypothetical protein